MTRNNLTIALNLSPTQCRNFLTDVMGAGYLYEQDNGTLMTAQDIFHKGYLSGKKIARNAGDGQYTTRVYIHGVRSLYQEARDVRQHKILSYIFQILPFVNRQYSMVCFNPLETVWEQVEPMTIKQFACTIGRSDSSANRIAEALSQVRFRQDGIEQYAIRYLPNWADNEADFVMFVNPNLYYAGDKWDATNIQRIFGVDRENSTPESVPESNDM
jgi:hypothetical protein